MEQNQAGVSTMSCSTGSGVWKQSSDPSISELKYLEGNYPHRGLLIHENILSTRLPTALSVQGY